MLGKLTRCVSKTVLPVGCRPFTAASLRALRRAKRLNLKKQVTLAAESETGIRKF